MSAPAVREACYCGTRWTVRPDGVRVCAHCDAPPPIKKHVGWSDGEPIYTCITLNRRRWDI